MIKELRLIAQSRDQRSACQLELAEKGKRVYKQVDNVQSTVVPLALNARDERIKD